LGRFRGKVVQPGHVARADKRSIIADVTTDGGREARHCVTRERDGNGMPVPLTSPVTGLPVSTLNGTEQVPVREADRPQLTVGIVGTARVRREFAKLCAYLGVRVLCQPKPRTVGGESILQPADDDADAKDGAPGTYDIAPVDEQGSDVYQRDRHGELVLQGDGEKAQAVPVYRRDKNGNVLLDKNGKPIPVQQSPYTVWYAVDGAEDALDNLCSRAWVKEVCRGHAANVNPPGMGGGAKAKRKPLHPTEPFRPVGNPVKWMFPGMRFNAEREAASGGDVNIVGIPVMEQAPEFVFGGPAPAEPFGPPELLSEWDDNTVARINDAWAVAAVNMALRIWLAPLL